MAHLNDLYQTHVHRLGKRAVSDQARAIWNASAYSDGEGPSLASCFPACSGDSAGQWHEAHPSPVSRYSAIVSQPTARNHQEGEPDPSAEWWTTSEVAAYLGVGVATVSSYRIRGQMPSPDMTLGRTHAWRPSKIIAWHEGRPRPGVGGRPRSGE